MSKSWSSFENDRLIMESWRRHINEEPEKVEEFLGFGKKKGWEAEAERQAKEFGEEPETPQKCPPGCCPCPGEEGQQPEEEYPAADYTSLYKTLDDVNNQLGGTVDRNALNKELQQLFKDQNFIVKERKIKMEAQGEVAGGKLILGRQPNFNLEKYPTLARLSQAAAANPKLAKALQGAFTRAGFEGVASAQAAAPEETAPEEEIPDVTGELEPEEGTPEEGDVEGEEDDVELEPDNIYVFKGKAGKGLQSQLAKAGVQGQDMSALLKGLRSDLSAAGFTVLEEAKREIIALTNTLAALEQMADPGQKEAAKKILALMLRANKVKLDPQSSRALTPVAAAGETTTPTQPPRTKAEKIKAGDSFQYKSGRGATSVVQVVKEPTPETQGFAQVQKIDPKTCQPQSQRKFGANPATLTTPYDQCSADQQAVSAPEAKGGDRSWANVPAQGGASYGTSARREWLDLSAEDKALLENWQKIAGIIKG